MGFVSEIAKSAEVLSGMMSRLHKAPVDPREIATEAHARQLRKMVLRCAACPDQAGCIALQSMSLTFEAPPAFCPNRQALQALPPRT